MVVVVTEERAEPSSPGDLFVAAPGGPAERVGAALQDRHPAVAAAAVVVAGWALLSTALVALGLLLTRVVLADPIAGGRLGEADADVNRWLALRRTDLLDTLTAWGSRLSDTLTIVVATAVLTLVFLIRRWWREALLLVLSPTVEVTAFLVTTFVVGRDRPPVEHLDTAPPTSSFPSGHVAAAVAFYVALALIIDRRARHAAVRIAGWVLAVLAPAAVLFSRLYRGMHFPTDVTVGVLGGLAALAVALTAVRAASWVAARHGPGDAA
jgi:membrane-associated phospholipid phosphatase